MTTGLSGTYSFDNVDFLLPPSNGSWKERPNYGIDGGAHPVYSSFRKFELEWDLMPMDAANQLINAYNVVGNTGTVVACLPKWNDPTFTFYNYSGCTMEEPVLGKFFQGFVQDVKLLILNVKTN